MPTDPQFGTFKLLRPFTGFNTVYNGQSAARRIMFTEDGEALEPGNNATNSPYNGNLVRGLKVPMGARIVIWFPFFTWVQSTSPSVTRPYIWCISWRCRSMFDFNRNGHQAPYHHPRSRITQGGQPPIPAAYQMITYTATEPTAAVDPEARDRVVSTVRAEDLRIGADLLTAPFTPSGADGVIQQGVGGTSPTLEGYAAYEIQAHGDELLIGLRRETDVVANWTFASTDASLLSNLTNSDEMGVLVCYGSAP